MASQFNDRLGRTWDLSLTLGHLTKVRKSLGIELGKILTDQKALLDLLESPETLGMVLFTILEEQAKAIKVDGDGFAEGFDGETVMTARTALVEAIANFTQPAKTAKQIGESLQRVMETKDELIAEKMKSETDKMLSVLKQQATGLVASAA